MSSGRLDDQGRPPPRDKSRNGLTSIANRDKPVFTSMRRHQGSQQGPDFFTNSLNTSFASHIPSPSPGRPTYGGRARQAHGNNGRGFAATDNALGRNGHDNESDASSPTRSAGRRSAQRTRLLISPERTSTRNSARSSTNRKSGEESGARTPSPPRERQTDYLVSPVSEASASSPPRGLAEAYRRIQDEETLTSQEDESSDDELGAENFGDQAVLAEDTNDLLGRSLGSPSPDSRRASRSLSQLFEADKACAAPGVELQGISHSTSPFDDDPDDDMSSQHERDEERVRSALSNHSQPFRKARRGLTLDSLRRHEVGSQSGSNSTGSQSPSSKASGLSLNVPNGWGRKGRTAKAWLQRIKESRPGDLSAQEPQPSDRTSDSIDDWVKEAAATPLPHVNSDSLQPTLSSAPVSKVQPPFREVSTTPSNTPPIRVRNAAIDAIRVREIQSLREQELTTNRLGELGEKNVIDRRGGRSSRAVSGEQPTLQEPGATPKSPSDADKTLQEYRKENDPIRREPLFEYVDGSAMAGSPIVNQPAAAHAKGTRSARDTGVFTRPRHERDDSREILRTLSRIEGNSPSSDRRDRPNESVQAKRTRSADGLPKSSIVETPKQSHLKTPLVTGAWIETPVAPLSQGDQLTSQQLTDKRALHDAALINAGAESLAQETFLVTDPRRPPVRLEDTAPVLPSSALADILQHARAKRGSEAGSDNDDTFQLDDSTIESLANLTAAPDSERPRSKSAGGAEDHGPVSSISSSSGDQEMPSTNAQRSENLLSKLVHLCSSIRHSKESVTALERKVSSSSSRRRRTLTGTVAQIEDKRRSLQRVSVDAEAEKCNEGGELHDFFIPCEDCMRRARAARGLEPGFIEWQTVRIPAPRLWIWHRNSWPRLTRVGWWVFLIGALVLLELRVA